MEALLFFHLPFNMFECTVFKVQLLYCIINMHVMYHELDFMGQRLLHVLNYFLELFILGYALTKILL